MHAGRLGRRDDRLARSAVGSKRRDILRDRAGEQLDVLRQVADVPRRAPRPTTGRASRRRAGPCRAHGGQTPTSARASVDLPEALGPMTPSPCPACEREADILRRSASCAPGGATTTLFEPRALRRRRSGRIGGVLPADSRRSSPAAAASSGARPRSGRQLRDRRARSARARAAAQDRGGDDDAGGGLAVDDEPGADAEHGRLQHEAERPSRARRARRRRRDARCCARDIALVDAVQRAP